MKGKDFKTLCRRCLNLEANGFHGEMPDDWNINIGTCLGEEDILSWDDNVSEKTTTIIGVSMDGYKEDALKHFSTEELLAEIKKRSIFVKNS
jgi:hypothetical protein